MQAASKHARLGQYRRCSLKKTNKRVEGINWFSECEKRASKLKTAKSVLWSSCSGDGDVNCLDKIVKGVDLRFDEKCEILLRQELSHLVAV